MTFSRKRFLEAGGARVPARAVRVRAGSRRRRGAWLVARPSAEHALASPRGEKGGGAVAPAIADAAVAGRAVLRGTHLQKSKKG